MRLDNSQIYNAEIARAQAEIERMGAEDNRVSAEEARERAEGSRVIAEQDRHDAYDLAEAAKNAALGAAEAANEAAEAATVSALGAQNANANWTKDTANPLSYFPAPSAPLYFRREGTFTQAGSGDPSPENIRPITPFMANGEQIKLANSGKNLYDISSYPLIQGSWVSAVSGSYTTLETMARTNSIPVSDIAGKVVTLNKRPGGNYAGFAFYDSLHVFISGHRNSNGTAGTPWTITIPANAVYMEFTVPSNTTDIQLELGSVATPYEPYVGSTATLTAPEEIAAGWINNRGEGQVTWAKKVLDGTEAWVKYDSNPSDNVYYASVFTGCELAFQSSICTHFKNVNSSWGTVGNYGEYSDHTSVVNRKYFNMGEQCPTVEDFKAFLAAQYAAGTPVTVYYQLATPVNISPVSAPLNSIPATDLATERLNIFTSSLSGVLTHPKNKVRQDRILNNAQLWRKTSSGNPVSAYPVPESPLYPKVSGTFTQEGTGDPSPENIRPITPWLASGAMVKVKRTGKNLLNLYGAYVNGYNIVNIQNTLLPNTTYTYKATGIVGGYKFKLFARIHPTNSSLGEIGLTSTYHGDGEANTFITPANIREYGYLLLGGSSSGASSVFGAANFQVELGSTATPYELYTETDIALTAPQEIPAGWMDNEGNGQVTWARKVFDGTEPWEPYRTPEWTATYVRVLLQNNLKDYAGGNFDAQLSITKPGPGTTEGYHPNVHIVLPSTKTLFLAVEIPGVTDMASWKAYLTAQHAAGTPVTMAYPCTPTPITPTLAPLTALPQLDRITPRQNVLTASTGNIELTYAKSPIREADEVRAILDGLTSP